MNKEISETTQNYIKEFEEKTGATVIYVTVSGSKLYGTDNENSDTDLKGIFIPSKESVILKKDLSSYVRDTNNSKIKNSAEDIDFTLHSIYSFFGQLQKSETGAIDTLFSMWSESIKSKELIEIEEMFALEDIKKVINKGDDIKHLLEKLKYK